MTFGLSMRVGRLFAGGKKKKAGMLFLVASGIRRMIVDRCPAPARSRKRILAAAGVQIMYCTAMMNGARYSWFVSIFISRTSDDWLVCHVISGGEMSM
jgi:hypothetical protein